MNGRLEAVLSTALTLSAVAIAGSAVHRQFFETENAGGTPAPTRVKGWEGLLANGARIGPVAAPVQIVVFGDFECPHCGALHTVLEEILGERPREVSLVFYHFPLSGIHPSAEGAARAAECAGEQDRLRPMMRELFADHEAFSTRSWASFARVAGVSDTVSFNRCMDDDMVGARIQAHIHLGRDFQVIAVPTVMINGWRLNSGHPPIYIKRYVEQFLAGQSPFSTDR